MDRFPHVARPSQASGGGGTDLESREMRPFAAAVVSVVSHWYVRPGLFFIKLNPDGNS